MSSGAEAEEKSEEKGQGRQESREREQAVEGKRSAKLDFVCVSTSWPHGHVIGGERNAPN